LDFVCFERRVDPGGGWFSGRAWRHSDEAFWVGLEGAIEDFLVEGNVDVRTKKGRFCELHAGQSAIVTEAGCALIPGFDPGFSPEFTGLQEFSQVQPGVQGVFGAESLPIYVVPAAAVVGGAATAAAVGTHQSAQSASNNLMQELLLLNASHPLLAISN
jgi:hypothetical protein